MERRGGGGVEIKYCYNILIRPTSRQILFDCFNHSYTTSYDQGDGGGGGGERDREEVQKIIAITF